jgi:hypothetical protein
MLSLQRFRGAFPYNHAGSPRVAGYDARHDRSIGDTKPFDPIDLEVSVELLAGGRAKVHFCLIDVAPCGLRL